MVAVRAKSTANVAEPDLPLSCNVTVPMCAKPIARSAGLFGVHFALRRSTCRRIKPFYSDKKVQTKPTRGPSISRDDITETWPVYCSFKHSDTFAKQSLVGVKTMRVYAIILYTIILIILGATFILYIWYVHVPNLVNSHITVTKYVYIRHIFLSKQYAHPVSSYYIVFDWFFLVICCQCMCSGVLYICFGYHAILQSSIYFCSKIHAIQVRLIWYNLFYSHYTPPRFQPHTPILVQSMMQSFHTVIIVVYIIYLNQFHFNTTYYHRIELHTRCIIFNHTKVDCCITSCLFDGYSCVERLPCQATLFSYLMAVATMSFATSFRASESDR